MYFWFFSSPFVKLVIYHLTQKTDKADVDSDTKITDWCTLMEDWILK